MGYLSLQEILNLKYNLEMVNRVKMGKKVLSTKKKKAEVIKNVLVKPYKNYWPLLSPEDHKHLLECMEKSLPRFLPTKINVPYDVIKTIPKEERKRYRQSLYDVDKIVDESELDDRNKIVFGVNSVTKLLEQQKVGSLLISNEVQPRFLVQHVLDQGILNSVPILVVSELKVFCKNKCGISGLVVAIRKDFNENSKLKFLHQIISKLSESYKIPDDHINYHRSLDNSTVTINDSQDKRARNSINTIVPKIENYHLVRSSNTTRAFIPGISDKNNSRTIQLSSFISLESSPEKQVTKRKGYTALKVKRMVGNKNRNKKKIGNIKKNH